jgi:SAM-dependent methyltransferase
VIRVGDWVVGQIGLAVLRAAVAGDEVGARRHLDTLRSALGRLDDDDDALTARWDLPEVGSRSGYATWAAAYDDPGNVTVDLEEAAVVPLLQEMPMGLVLDAACGTGRHAVHLVAQGHRVVGVDSSVGMLERAASKLGQRFAASDLHALPFADGSFDAAVCALALSHERDVAPGVAELARVVRPGGRLIISVPHWLLTEVIGARAVVGSAYVPEYGHRSSTWLAAFFEAGLVVRDCLEPSWPDDAGAKAVPHDDLRAAARAARAGLPAVMVWDLLRST